MPETFAALQKDPLTFRFRGGESFSDLVRRSPPPPQRHRGPPL